MPLRQPTLESQRGGAPRWSLIAWFRRSRRRTHSPDNFERIIEATQHEAKPKERRELIDLVHDYRRLRLRPGAQISQCLIWLKNFTTPIPRPLAECFEPAPLHFVAESSFSLCLQKVADALRTDAPGQLQLCAIAAEADEKILSRTFSFTCICGTLTGSTTQVTATVN